MTRFHEGERAVQRRAGVEHVAAKVGRNIVSWLPPEFADFLMSQPLIVAAGQDPRGRVWASLIGQGAGSARALDDRHLLLAGGLEPDDPLAAAFEQPGTAIGILAIEPHSRARIRINGLAHHTADGLLVTVQEAFGNCPKYIHRRIPADRHPPARRPRTLARTRLHSRQIATVVASDTFFIASAHPQRGADASHRAGPPGFVEASPEGRRLRFPDYPGNRMFQTLGNLAVDPRVGLLFVDWESGTALQVSGRAQLLWDGTEVGAFPGAERVVDVEVDVVRECPRALPYRWRLL